MNTLNAMTTFVEVARAGSFSAAARQLGVSTTAVSRHVADLEQMLGVTLLRRSTRNVSPTEAGSQYLPRAAAALEEINRLNLEIADSGQEPQGHLRITAPPSVGHASIALLAVEFAEAYPKVTVELEIAQRLVDLVAEGFDAAIRSGPLESSSLISHRIIETRYQLYASPDYLKRRGTPKSPEDVSNHDCIGWIGTARPNDWFFIHDGKTISVPIRCRLQVTDLEAQRAAALRGLGLATLPCLSVQDDLKEGRLVALLPDHEMDNSVLSLVRPRTPFMPTKLRVFIDFITAALRRGPVRAGHHSTVGFAP